MTFLILWLYFGIIILAVWLARQKGYSEFAWLFITMFFGVFALIAIAGAPINGSAKNPVKK